MLCLMYFVLPAYVGSAIQHVHQGYHAAVVKVFKTLGVEDNSDVERFFSTDDSWSRWLKRTEVSRDGKHTYAHKDEALALVHGTLSLASTASMDLSWLSSLPAPNSPTLLGTHQHWVRVTNARVLVARTLEQEGRLQERPMPRTPTRQHSKSTHHCRRDVCGPLL